MRRLPIPCALLLAAACHTADNGPTAPPPGPSLDEARVLNGPAECDGCEGLSMMIGGPGAYYATSAVFESRNPPGQPVEAAYQLRRFTGDSGKVLELGVSFTDTVPAGEYELRLRIPEGGGTRDLVIERALVMTSAYVPPTTPQPPTDSVPVRFLATVSGQDPDERFQVVACGQFSACRSFPLIANVPFQRDLPTEDLVVELRDVAANCTVADGAQRSVPLRPGDAQTTVTFEVTCRPRAYLRVLVAASGPDRDESFVLACAQATCGFTLNAVGTETVLEIASGTHEVQLTGVESNCTVTDGADRVVTVAGTDTLLVQFTLACIPHGVVRVSTHTIGTNPDFSYTLTNSWDCGYDYYYGSECETWTLTEPEVLELRGPRAYQLQVGDVNGNCVVLGGLTRFVQPMPGTVTDLVITVACQ